MATPYIQVRTPAPGVMSFTILVARPSLGHYYFRSMFKKFKRNDAFSLPWPLYLPQEPLPHGSDHKIYKFGRPFLDHHFYIQCTQFV